MRGKQGQEKRNEWEGTEEKFNEAKVVERWGEDSVFPSILPNFRLKDRVIHVVWISSYFKHCFAPIESSYTSSY